MKKLLSAILAAALMLTSAVSVGAELPEEQTAQVIVLGANTLSFSKAAGTYSAPFYLNMSAPSGAKLYYTTNGTVPTTKSTAYTSSVLISKTTTVKAIYVLNGKKSKTFTKKYTIKAAAPTASVASGIYGESICVELYSSGATIYYTTDGTTPTKKSRKYTSPLLIESDCVLQAVAYKTGCSKSSIMVEDYVILTKVIDTDDYTFDRTNKTVIDDSTSDYWNEYWYSYWKDYFSTEYDPFDDDFTDPVYPDLPTDNPPSADTTQTTDTTQSSTVTYSWSDGTNNWEWAIEIPTEYITYAKNHPNMAADRVNYDYEKYVTDTYDDGFIQGLADGFRSAASDIGYNENQLLNMVITFVQNIEYVSDYQSKGQAEYPKYPAETLLDANGDCEDSAALLTSLFKALGYDACMLEFSDHMASGICGNFSGTYFSYNGKNYYFVETTSVGWGIGEFSVNYNSAYILAA